MPREHDHNPSEDNDFSPDASDWTDPPPEARSGFFPAPPMPEVLARPGPAEASPDSNPPPRSSAIQTGKVFAIGMDFAYGVVGCAALGWFADWWFKTSPRWLLIGAGVGLLVAMYRFVREGLKLSKGATQPESVRNGKSK